MRSWLRLLSVPFAEDPPEADADLRPVEVVAQADRLREVLHRRCSRRSRPARTNARRGRRSRRRRTRRSPLAARSAVEMVLPTNEPALGADHRPEADREERLQRLIPKVTAATDSSERRATPRSRRRCRRRRHWVRQLCPSRCRTHRRSAPPPDSRGRTACSQIRRTRRARWCRSTTVAPLSPLRHMPVRISRRLRPLTANRGPSPRRRVGSPGAAMPNCCGSSTTRAPSTTSARATSAPLSRSMRTSYVPGSIASSTFRPRGL